jgi:NAD(P)-dependent dehydrogenase (short-subunit alcohol dehydrogenase family)
VCCGDYLVPEDLKPHDHYPDHQFPRVARTTYCLHGVRVNAVSAGIIKTPMHSLESHPFLASLHPMGRMGEASEIVDAILYLDSANFITGEILHVDGGQAAGHHAITL